MKKIGEYTARGIVTEEQTEAGEPQLIRLFDGRFNTGYIITKFNVWAADTDSNVNVDCLGKLSKNAIGTTSFASFFRADDDNQIAWAVSGFGLDGSNAGQFAESIIDRDNFVVEDLYVYVRCADPDDASIVNYYIEMDKYEVTEFKGALAMARDRADGE